MANITVDKWPFKYTEGELTPVDNTFTFGDIPSPNKMTFRDFVSTREVWIRVLTGSVQFNINGVVEAGSPTINAADEDIKITLKVGVGTNGVSDVLNFKAGAQNDDFIMYG